MGRGHHEHGAAAGAGYRNGYRTGRLKTAEGPIGYAAPQVANRDAPFRSVLREGMQGRTQALEDLAVELFARRLSTRDIADVFTAADGRPLLSRAAVSQLSERLWAEYQALVKRDLAEYDIVDLVIDGIAERLRPGQPREPVLAAWGIARDGRKVLLHLMAGSRQDVETVRAFFQDIRARGLNDPLLVVTDGAPATRPRPGRSPASCAPAWSPTTSGSCPTPWPASKTTSRPASPTCAPDHPPARAPDHG